MAAEAEPLEGKQKSPPLRWPLAQVGVRIWGRNQAEGTSGLWCVTHTPNFQKNKFPSFTTPPEANTVIILAPQGPSKAI